LSPKPFLGIIEYKESARTSCHIVYQNAPTKSSPPHAIKDKHLKRPSRQKKVGYGKDSMRSKLNRLMIVPDNRAMRA